MGKFTVVMNFRLMDGLFGTFEIIECSQPNPHFVNCDRRGVFPVGGVVNIFGSSATRDMPNAIPLILRQSSPTKIFSTIIERVVIYMIGAFFSKNDLVHSCVAVAPRVITVGIWIPLCVPTLARKQRDIASADERELALRQWHISYRRADRNDNLSLRHRFLQTGFMRLGGSDLSAAML